MFDFAYQGFGKGIDEDAKPIRYFLEQGHEMIVCASMAKNFGLYGERIGITAVVTKSKDLAARIGSQIKHIIRSFYFNPPKHGALIVSTILKNPDLKESWKHEVKNMNERIVAMREAFAFGLQEKWLIMTLALFLNKKACSQ